MSWLLGPFVPAFARQADLMSDAISSPQAMPRPAAPRPLRRPPNALSFLYGLWRNPITTWSQQSFREPIVLSQGVMGRVALVNDPAAVRHVFVDNVANYRKDALQMRVLRPGLGTGLLTAEGDDWRVQRRALAPLFTPRMVAEFLQPMMQSADWLVQRWAPLREGRRIDLASEMSRVTLDVLERTIFPQGLTRDPAAFAKAMGAYFDSMGQLHPLDVIQAPDWLPRIGKRYPREELKFFDEAVRDMISAQTRWLQDHPGKPTSDLMTRLLAARDPQTGEALSEMSVRSNVLTFVGAGHETTAMTLTWSLYLLALHPEWRAKVEAEVDEILGDGELNDQQLPQLIRIRATIEEAMRLYPPAASLSREAIDADELSGHKIRAGTLVIVAPWVLHRHHSLWEKPDYFMPERFMPEQRESINRYAYIPFGAGPRVCIGMGFALQEATALLATIVRNHQLDLAPGHKVEPVMRITLRPKGGMPMILRKRHHS